MNNNQQTENPFRFLMANPIFLEHFIVNFINFTKNSKHEKNAFI
jgi:hypothetical protein